MLPFVILKTNVRCYLKEYHVQVNHIVMKNKKAMRKFKKLQIILDFIVYAGVGNRAVMMLNFVTAICNVLCLQNVFLVLEVLYAISQFYLEKYFKNFHFKYILYFNHWFNKIIKFLLILTFLSRLIFHIFLKDSYFLIIIHYLMKLYKIKGCSWFETLIIYLNRNKISSSCYYFLIK